MLKHQKSNKPTTASELRAHAEDRLRYKPETNAVLSYSKDELLRLNHELSVHQIELEMQADELRYSSDLLALSNADLEASFSQYADLYEFTYAVLVDRLERICGQYLVIKIIRQE